jgi:hypothetical protein
MDNQNDVWSTWKWTEVHGESWHTKLLIKKMAQVNEQMNNFNNLINN